MFMAFCWGKGSLNPFNINYSGNKMKLGRLFASRWYRMPAFAALAVSLFLLPSCHSETHEEVSELLIAADFNSCCPADSVDFPLEAEVVETGNSDFEMHLETGTYQLSDCLCEVQNFELTFEGVSPEWPILVLDSRGDTVQVDITVDGSGMTTISIPQPQDLPGEFLTISIDFGMGENDERPTLVTAGGLCIIENVVGTIIGQSNQTMAIPYQLTSSPANGPTINRVFIPTSIGGPPY